MASIPSTFVQKLSPLVIRISNESITSNVCVQISQEKMKGWL
jgi:hypothetical protein